jgi:hypothetical protein
MTSTVDVEVEAVERPGYQSDEGGTEEASGVERTGTVRYTQAERG